MTNTPIKPTHIYDWDIEPVDERPSEFMNSSSWSASSSFHPPVPQVRRPPLRFGFVGVLFAALTLLALGALAMAKIIPLLRG